MSLTCNVVDATVDDHCSLLDPLSFHHLCSPDPDNQDVCFAHLGSKRVACVTVMLGLVDICFMTVNRNFSKSGET